MARERMALPTIVAVVLVLAMVSLPYWSFEWAQYFVRVVAAVATIIVAFVAVLKDTIQFQFFGTRFHLEYDPEDIDMFPNGEIAFYHLTVKQERSPWLDRLAFPRPATNCRVLLQRAEGERIDDGAWCPSPNPELQFRWPLEWKENKPSSRPIGYHEKVTVDFGELSRTTKRFTPSLYQYRDKFDEERDGGLWGCVGPNQTVRYHVRFICDQFASPKPEVFEVYWDGEFPTNRYDAAQHLRIKRL